MIAIPIEKVQAVIDDLEDKINKLAAQKKKDLASLFIQPLLPANPNKRELATFNKNTVYFNSIATNPKEADYINLILAQYEKLVTAKPKELLTFKKAFDQIIPEDKITAQFKDIVIEKMGYTALRTGFYPEYFAAIGLKACVFCNSQFAVVSNKSSAHFEVDHYLSKSKFPCFCTSLYNLYPICGSCNKRKSNNEIKFDLYLTDSKLNTKSEFSFEIVKSSLADYLVNGDMTAIQIRYEPPPASANFDKVFKITGIYHTQIDVAEELILKSKIYTDNYKKSLVKSFGKLYGKGHIGNRVLIGNYCEEYEIHNRPMAKFTQDIARQLGLID